MNRVWRIDLYPRVNDTVSALDERHRMAFATACAERALRRIDAWAADRDARSSVFRHAVEVLWKFVAGEASADDVRVLEKAVRKAIPHDDEEEVTFGADRAGLAVLYAVQCALRPSSPKLAINAAEESYLAWGSVETLRESSPVTLDVMDARERRMPMLQTEIDFQDELLRAMVDSAGVSGADLVSLSRRVVHAS
jgi:hypothetical protein